MFFVFYRLFMNIWRLVKIRKHEDGPKGLVINYGEGGLQNGKIAGPKLVPPPPQDRVKLFAPPLLKSGNFSRLPYNMALTYKLVVPPLQHGSNFVRPPLFIGVKLHVPPPSRFVAPPPIPVISDQFLNTAHSPGAGIRPEKRSQ